jgi:biopolymer transport protein ExbD
VLLIIFMLSQTQARKTMPVSLPNSAQGRGTPTPEIVLELLADGGYALNGAAVAADALPGRLATVYAGRRRGVLFMRAAPTRRYQEVIEAADIARGAGVGVISLAPGRSSLGRLAPGQR